MAEFLSTKNVVSPKVNCPLGLTWIGFSFWIDPRTHRYVCGPWPYPGGYRHGQIFDRREDVKKVVDHKYFRQGVDAMLYKVDTNELIRAKSLSVSIDWDSWTWQFSAEILSKTDLDKIKPTDTGPVEVEARINGWKFRAIVEKWNDQHSFNSRSYSVSGRSPIAVLDQPYRLPQTHSLTSDTSAQQFVEQLMSSYGYSVVWEVDDWLMKKDAFSVLATPIRACLYVTDAIAAFILPHHEEKQITVRKKHKHKSWTWGGQSPDVVLPPSLTVSVSGEFIPKKDINCVYVQGSKPGAVAVKVVLSGTAGDKALGEITHDLITDTVAGRQRGEQELSFNLGPFRKNTIATVLTRYGETGPGLLLPGTFVEFFIDGVSHKGAVAGTTVSATFDEKGLKVVQSLDVISTVGG